MFVNKLYNMTYNILRSSKTYLFAYRANNLFYIGTANYAKSAEQRLGIDKPKRPLTPFFKYAGTIRSTILKANPDESVISVMKIVTEKWNGLDAASKEKLKKEYEKDMEDYKKIKLIYDTSLSEEQLEDIKRVKAEMELAKEKKKAKAEYKKLGRPKRPVSSYLLFGESEKANTKNMNLKQAQEYVTQKWKQLSPEEKAVWEQKVKVLWDKYRKELNIWEEKMIDAGQSHFVRRKSIASASSDIDAKRKPSASKSE